MDELVMIAMERTIRAKDERIAGLEESHRKINLECMSLLNDKKMLEKIVKLAKDTFEKMGNVSRAGNRIAMANSALAQIVSLEGKDK